MWEVEGGGGVSGGGGGVGEVEGRATAVREAAGWVVVARAEVAKAAAAGVAAARAAVAKVAGRTARAAAAVGAAGDQVVRAASRARVAEVAATGRKAAKGSEEAWGARAAWAARAATVATAATVGCGTVRNSRCPRSRWRGCRPRRSSQGRSKSRAASRRHRSPSLGGHSGPEVWSASLGSVSRLWR